MRIRWFGNPSWKAPVCEKKFHINTPVGSKCLECGKPIGEKDRGVVTGAGEGVWGTWQLITGNINYRVCSYHLSCFMAVVVGGVTDGTPIGHRMVDAVEFPVETYNGADVQLIEEDSIEDTREETARRGAGWKT